MTDHENVKVPGAPYAGDERDHYVAPADVNAEEHWVMYSVFSLDEVLPLDDAERASWVSEATDALTATGVTVRGFYDIAGMRSDADLLIWTLGESAEQMQAAYHAFRRTQLGSVLAPVWSSMGVFREMEFNRNHTPGCFSGIAARPWVCVYPFVRSYEWYMLDPSKRAVMLRDHGRAVRDFPDVIGSTTACFGLNDYEWLLAFEGDQPTRIVDTMRAARSVEARMHVRVETPFFTGPRVELQAWADVQPRG